jgi:hypothetical protein
MTVFMTKVWGFGEPAAPLQFSGVGWRERAKTMLKPGDLVVLVGTQGAETQNHERNMILGMMEPTHQAVSALDFLRPDRPEDFDENGNYRWPYGLLNLRAWRFDEPRRSLKSISDRQFNMDAAQGIVPLLDDEAEQVLKLPRTEVTLRTSFRTQKRIEGDDAARRKGAPTPTTTRTGVMHWRDAPAFTYCMRISRTDDRGRKVATNSFKIGWAFDWQARRKEFNKASLPALGGLQYDISLKELWPTAKDAFRMEQAILRQFDDYRHTGNQEVLAGVDQVALEVAWAQTVKSPAWHAPA